MALSKGQMGCRTILSQGPMTELWRSPDAHMCLELMLPLWQGDLRTGPWIRDDQG